jgi:hypothetical protein
MDAAKRLTTVEFDSSYRTLLEEFCDSCSSHGYTNNSSLEAMRLDWCIATGGQFFLTLLDEKIISVSGCHPLLDYYRVLFRGATLPEYQNIYGVPSKTHMGSIPFFSHLPLQLSWSSKTKYRTSVVTTNWNNPDGITSMSHSHRVFQLLARQGIVSCLHEKINIFNTDQSVWGINQEAYFSAREGFKVRNGLH